MEKDCILKGHIWTEAIELSSQSFQWSHSAVEIGLTLLGHVNPIFFLENGHANAK